MLGCPQLVAGRRWCPAHTRPAPARPKRRAWPKQDGSLGATAGWRVRRMFVLRDQPLCPPCLAAGRVAVADEVDHIVPRAQGGTHAYENLQGLCRAHHYEKTLRETQTAIQTRRQERRDERQKAQFGQWWIAPRGADERAWR
jgi:5-methylcytosine-specific restriction protein A